jgi:hypothetical protein
MSDRWAVPLEDVDHWTLDDAKWIAAEGPTRIRDVRVGHDQWVVALQADELEREDDAAEVLATARRLVDYVNGALFLCDPGRPRVRIPFDSSVLERDETGIYRQRHTSPGGSTQDRTQARPTAAAEALALAARDEAVADVLVHLRAFPDHRGLYNAYERIKRDVVDAQGCWEASGQKGARPEFPWPDAGGNEFRRSAQPFRHGDPTKWAGRKQETAIPLSEARALVSGWVCKWLQLKQASA